jgi:multiple sugar transport system permease protein
MTTTIAERPVVALRRRRWEGLPYWLILPTVAYLGVFFAWPMVQSFHLAFQDANGNWSFTAVRGMYHDADFGPGLRFTLLLVAVIVPLQFVLALVMALVVNAKLRGRGIVLFIFILPLAVSDLAAGLVWQSIFTDHGYLNTVLQAIGVLDQPKIWIDPAHSNWLLGEVVLTEMWRSTSFIMVILVAGLQGIPKDCIEAAEVFASVIAITGRTKTTLAGQALRWQSEYLDSHVAAAYALLIMVLSLVAAGLVVRMLRTPRERLLR